MGCANSSSKDLVEKLNAVQVDLDANKAGEGATGLDVMAKCAKELSDVFEELVRSGAKDAALLDRVQLMSDDVVKNLTSRLTFQFLQGKETEPVVERIFAIAKQLDTFRAVKASSTVQQELDAVQARIATQVQQQVVAALKTITKPEELMAGATKALNIMDVVHKRAPESTTVSDLLLQRCMDLTALVMQFFLDLVEVDMASAPKIFDLASRIDTLAGKLVVVMGAAWDPPVRPTVEAALFAKAVDVVSQELDAIDVELAKDSDKDSSVLIKSTAALKPWWVHAAKSEELGVRLLAMLEHVHGTILAGFRKSIRVGEDAKCKGLLAFAKSFDAATAGLEPLPSEDESILCLVGKLEAEHKSNTCRLALDRISAELSEGRETSLQAVLQDFEVLVSLWSEAVRSPDLPGRLEEIAASLEVWADAQCASAGDERDGERLVELRTFGAKYEGLRRKCTPPDVTDGQCQLHRKVLPLIDDVYLFRVEEESSKEAESLDFSVVIERLTNFSSVSTLPRSEAIKERILTTFSDMETKAVVLFALAGTNGDEDRMTSLLSLASSYDVQRANIEGPPSSAVALKDQLEACSAVHQQLSKAEAECGKDTGFNSKVFLDALNALQPLWKSAKVPAFHSRLETVWTQVRGHLNSAVDKAFDSGDLQKPVALVGYVAQLDQAKSKLTEDLEALPALQGPLRLQVVTKFFALIDARLADTLPTLDDMAACTQSFGVLKVLCDKGALEEAQEPMVIIMDRIAGVVDARLVALLFADVAPASIEACSRCAEGADNASAVIHGQAVGSVDVLTRRVRATIPRAKVAKALATCEEELAKETGLNSKLLLTSVQSIGPLWKDLGEEGQAERERTVAACQAAAARMGDSMDQAAEAKEKPKINALIKFAQDFDKACKPFDGYKADLAANLKERSKPSNRGNNKPSGQ